MNEVLTKVNKHFEDADSQLQKAKDDLANNRSPDLSGLDTVVSEACDLVKTLTEEEREQVKGKMISLMDDITSLTSELKQQQESLEGALRENKSHAQATIAYRKPKL